MKKIKGMSKREQAGFTLLLAALVSSIVLSLGAAVFEIASKQIELASIGRDSQFAFYAADSAAECALFWDSRSQYFATTTPTNVSPTCDSQALSVSPTYTTVSPASYPYTQTFEYQPNNLCAIVSVTKCNGSISASGVCTASGNGVVSTLIHADGYSVPCSATSTSQDALQRSVELRF